MKKKMMAIMFSLLFAMPVLGLAEGKNGPKPSESAYKHADENAKFQRNRAVFNNKKNKIKRAKKRVKKKSVVEAEAKKKIEEAQDKGKGQVKLKF
ncbi:MAG: hypothetical protein HQL27_06360 [Candidatus Omnitrophica bacterium]|nr:hypothetical protein [Candidatus Omnitrophota bacterium]